MRTIISFLAPGKGVPENLQQYVFITNILSLTLSVLTVILMTILYLLFGVEVTTYMIFGVAVLFLFVILLNRLSFFNTGRLIFCLVPVWLTLFISIYGKMVNPQQSEIVYFDSRYILLATVILPAVVFRLNERVKIITCFVSTFICLAFFDPLHNMLEIGYYQRGFTSISYYYINYVTLISFLIIFSGVMVLKWITEKAELTSIHSLKQKDDLNQQLKEQNLKLIKLNTEVEAQNEELHQQQEELSASRELLEGANTLIHEQKERLVKYNEMLKDLVEQKSTDLIKANEELVKHNNELRQFSYTVSHNLRGPVARLLGLTNLLNSGLPAEENHKMMEFLHQSTSELDTILKDLNLIIDIRNDLYRVREKVMLEDEFSKAISILGENVKPEFKIVTNFVSAPYLFVIRAMLQSILYNLLSNAIKYRSPERMLRVDIKSYSHSEKETILEIRDNGLGIDLEKQRSNVFKLYKRFHTHMQGKGLGLYLVKTQVEALNGKIEVESEINNGTFFKLTFITPEAVDRQVFFESEAAQLYYDAHLNNTVIIWKRNITSIEYRNAFETVLQTLKTYRTPGWIADLRNQGTVLQEDQLWFVTNVVPEAVRNGLKRIATIGFNDPIRKDYYDRMIVKSAELGVTLRVFNSMEESMAWMHEIRVGGE